MHFALLVVGDDIDRQLMPFNENMDVPEYEEGIVTDDEKEGMMKWYRKNGATFDTFDECYKAYGEEYNGNCWRVDGNGVWRSYSTYNPNSKWDWWEVGGRWAGSFKLKEGTSPKYYNAPNFSWGWSDEDKVDVLSEGRVDSALKGDIEGLGCCTFAILKDGIWTERDWDNDESEESWESRWNAIVSTVGDNEMLTIVDYHI